MFEIAFGKWSGAGPIPILPLTNHGDRPSRLLRLCVGVSVSFHLCVLEHSILGY